MALLPFQKPGVGDAVVLVVASPQKGRGERTVSRRLVVHGGRRAASVAFFEGFGLVEIAVRDLAGPPVGGPHGQAPRSRSGLPPSMFHRSSSGSSPWKTDA